MATIVDRISSSASLLCIILLGLLASPAVPQLVQQLAASFLLLGILLLVLWYLQPKSISTLLNSSIPEIMKKRIPTFLEALELLATHRKTILQSLFLSLIISLISVSSNFVLMHAIVPGMTLAAFAIALPLARVASALPLTIGGIGALETVLLELLRSTGAIASDIVTFSAIIYASTIVGSLVTILVTKMIDGTQRSSPSLEQATKKEQ